MKKLSKYILPVAFGAMALQGCKKDLLDTKPYDQISSSAMWMNENTTDLGVQGIYSAFRDASVNIYQFDQYSYTGQYISLIGMMGGTITPGAGDFSSNWRTLYEGIIRTNDAIANIPAKSPVDEKKKGRLVAESKFFRAYFYYRLNELFKGVPLYLEPTSWNEFNKPRNTEEEVWAQVIKDLTEAINEPELPAKYAKGNASYGRVPKGAAYALRGKAYMQTKQWDKAITDFAAVKTAGYSLFPDYVMLFKEANEQSDEMIFSVQNIAVPGMGTSLQLQVGARSAGPNAAGCWNNYIPSPNLVDLYENADGSMFDWNEVIPGYNEMQPRARQVYFLRDNMTAAEISSAKARGADMTKYLPTGNEARILKAYAGRDPRLGFNVITPYSTFNGILGAKAQTVTSRFPYRASEPTDLRTNSTSLFLYLYRKFVAEGTSEIIDREYSSIDQPIIRYADVLLLWAEALNEKGDMAGAMAKVNEVRARVKMPALQSADATLPTHIANQSMLREKIRNERRAEFPNEGINYFDELRWKTLPTTIFKPGNGTQQVWGQNIGTYSYDPKLNAWAIPQAEIQYNNSLTQNPGWPQ